MQDRIQEYAIQCGPKSKPLPKDQKIVLNRIKPISSYIRFIRQIKVWINSILFVGIRYSVRDLLSDLSNYAWPAN